jgi:hypothetical protein
MKDSRVTVWTNTPEAHLTGSTTNTGPTIDLYASGAMVGGTSDGPEEFGIGAQIIQTYVSGTQTTVWEWEVSADDSTWRKGGFIASVALTAAGTDKIKTALRTRYRYARLLATNSGTGASTSVAYPEDMGGIPTIQPSYA